MARTIDIVFVFCKKQMYLKTGGRYAKVRDFQAIQVFLRLYAEKVSKK